MRFVTNTSEFLPANSADDPKKKQKANCQSKTLDYHTKCLLSTLRPNIFLLKISLCFRGNTCRRGRREQPKEIAWQITKWIDFFVKN